MQLSARAFVTNSLSVYAISLISISLRFVVPYDGVQVFAAVTNLAYALPFVFFLREPPMLMCALLVTTIQGSGSFAHHVRNCRDETYRILDFYGYIITYIVIAVFAIHKLSLYLVESRLLNVILLRCMLITGVTLATIFFDDIVGREIIVLPVLGGTAGVVLMLCYRVAYKQDLSTVFALSVTLLALFGVAYYLNVSGDSPWGLVDEAILEYELPHGWWHILTAKAQFLFLCLLLGNGVQTLKDWDWYVVLVNLALVASVGITYAIGVMDLIEVVIISSAGTLSWIVFSWREYSNACTLRV